MKLECLSLTLLGFAATLARAETIIGYDGKEHHWQPHRDGLHDHALHEQAQHRRHSLSHPRLRRWDGRHVPHMLNQAPIIVSQHNLHIATPSRHTRSLGHAVEKSPANLTSILGNATQETATALSRMEENMLDSVYSDASKEGKKVAAKRGKSFHFRVGHKQTEQNAAEDLTAQEVEMERTNRARLVRTVAGGAPAPAAGPAPAPGPMAAPAGAPGPAAEPESNPGANGQTMDEDLGAQEQGFSGEIVEHDNMKTMTKDWRGEYGPGASGIHDYVKICAAYPDNQWCRDRGYHRVQKRPTKSAALRPAAGAIMTFVVAASSTFLLG